MVTMDHNVCDPLVFVPISVFQPYNLKSVPPGQPNWTAIINFYMHQKFKFKTIHQHRYPKGTDPKDQNSVACWKPLVGDSHLFTASTIFLFECFFRNQFAISWSAEVTPACAKPSHT